MTIITSDIRVMDKKISAAPSVRRLPSYLQIVRRLLAEGQEYVSATCIADELVIEPIQVRKDLALTGVTGIPRNGFPLAALADFIERFLGWDRTRNAVLVGAGNLGSALLGYTELRSHRLEIRAAFDSDPHKAGLRIHGIEILPMRTLPARLPHYHAPIAILTVPAPAAQQTTDILVNAGIEGIWNFTNVKLRVPGTVAIQQEDISSGYAMLCAQIK
jgi:redox-sensing transcriptional repressor